MVQRNPEMLRGTVELLILTTLRGGPRHGFGIARWLEQTSDDELQLEEGSLYPALHKLEQQRWISAEWRNTENNRRAKIYSLTPPGRRYLRQEAANWERLSQAITHVVRLTEV